MPADLKVVRLDVHTNEHKSGIVCNLYVPFMLRIFVYCNQLFNLFNGKNPYPHTQTEIRIDRHCILHTNSLLYFACMGVFFLAGMFLCAFHAVMHISLLIPIACGII